MLFSSKNETMILFRRKKTFMCGYGIDAISLYSNQEVKISMEKLLGVIYDSPQRTISDRIIKEG